MKRIHLMSLLLIVSLSGCGLEDLLHKIAFKLGYDITESKLEKQLKQSQDIILAPAPAPSPLAVFDMDEIATTTRDKESHSLKVTIGLGYEENKDLESELKQRKDSINNICRILIKDKSYDELNNVEDAVNLAEEIKAHINVLLIKGKIKEVYFKEFIVD